MPPAATAAWHEMETTAIDGTTIELFSDAGLAGQFGVPAGGTKPKLRIAAHVRTASRRWIAAAVGGYLDGENTLAGELEDSFTNGILNLADRGFFSMNRLRHEAQCCIARVVGRDERRNSWV